MRKLNYRSLTVAFILLIMIAAPLSKPIKSVQGATGGSGIAPELQETLASMDADDMITVIVTMRSQADLSRIQANSRQDLARQVIIILQNWAKSTQQHIRALLELKKDSGEVTYFESFWVFNGLVVTATADVIGQLAARPEIKAITPNEIDVIEAAKPPMPPAPSAPEPNLSVVQAPELWDLGIDGQGIVVAILDSGVDGSHPDLFARWRGGSNSWFDPYGQHSTPTDFSGHGTWTTGVIVGGNAGGTDIGVAPGAEWIAAKIFNDSGNASASAIHASFQWVLDPDGDPGTPDSPNVVNNSWNFADGGCHLDFELDLQALRAAGILPVFAAGNAGPGSETSRSPANNPSAFAVGNTTDSDVIYFESSRGPSSCGEPATVFPEMVAPGFDIYTTDLYGLYYQATGTSLSAPHVSGALALLLSDEPNLTALDQEEALVNGATDLGPVGPDNDYGYGRLNVLASYEWLQVNGTPPPTDPGTLHVGNLDGSSAKRGKNWTATVTVTVHNGDEVPLADALLSGTWSGGFNGMDSCITDGNGQCSLSTAKINGKQASVTFSVEDLSLAEFTYEPADNHDPDGNSDGNMITVINGQ